MFRFTIRDALWLTVLLATAAAVFFARSAPMNDLPVATHRASNQEIEAANARYKAAKGEFEWQVSESTSYNQRWEASDAFDAAERLAHAVEELPDPELRVKELAKALEFVQPQVSIIRDKYEHEVEPAFMLYRAQYISADLEARLRRVEQELAAARASK
jgi:hypothetical protein